MPLQFAQERCVSDWLSHVHPPGDRPEMCTHTTQKCPLVLVAGVHEQARGVQASLDASSPEPRRLPARQQNEIAERPMETTDSEIEIRLSQDA